MRRVIVFLLALSGCASSALAQSSPADYRLSWGILSELVGRDFGARDADSYWPARVSWIEEGQKLIVQYGFERTDNQCIYTQTATVGTLAVVCTMSGQVFDDPRNTAVVQPDGTVKEVLHFDETLLGFSANKGGYFRDKAPAEVIWKHSFSAYDYHFIPIELVGPKGDWARSILQQHAAAKAGAAPAPREADPPPQSSQPPL